MSDRDLPEAVARPVAEIHAATLALSRAAERGIAEEIDQAIDERNRAVERMQSALDRHGEQIEPATRKALAEALALGASEAEAGLRELIGDARRALGALTHGARAVRAYDASARGPSSLDRSG